MHAEPLVIPEEIPEEEQAVTPGDDSNDDPTPPLPVDPPGTPSRNPAVDASSAAGFAGSTGSGEPLKREESKEETKEEPEIGNERDIPSDGRDPEGEGMIREVEKTTGPAERPEGS